ncbi:MAG: hypothetical protein ABIA11_04245 [Patescibacteria group bacterium]
MKSIFKVIPIEDKKLQRFKNKAIKELNEFFERKWLYNTPKIFIVDDRKTINLLREEKTKDWTVGWSWGTNAIFILNPNNISTESSHNYSISDIGKLIKHELCHSFFHITFGDSNFSWINEGVALYMADQLENYKGLQKYKGFLDGKNVYFESGHAIKLLIDIYGKKKLFEFLKKQNGIKTDKDLRTVFKKVYNEKLDYSLFNELKNKSSD